MDDTYNIATLQEQERRRKQLVSQVDNKGSEANDDEVAAFMCHQNKQKNNPQSN
jgi:hypothetical protein